MPYPWNDGIVEYWNVGFYKDIIIFSKLLVMLTSNHYPRTHYSILPAFQYSNWVKLSLGSYKIAGLE